MRLVRGNRLKHVRNIQMEAKSNQPFEGVVEEL